jgi:hypothetical protein
MVLAMGLPLPDGLPVSADDWARLPPDVQAVVLALWTRLHELETRLDTTERRLAGTASDLPGSSLSVSDRQSESLDAPPAVTPPRDARPARVWAPSPRRWRAPRVALWSLLIVLLVASIAPAALGWRLIAAYADLPPVVATVERNVELLQPNTRPISGAQGIAVAADGAIFVADENPRRLLAFPNGDSASGAIIGSVAGPEQLQDPFAVALGPSGTVHLLDRATGMVALFDRSGAFQRADKLAGPGARAIAIDDAGDIFIGDTGAHVVRKYRADGQPDLAWGDGATPGAVRLGEIVGLATLAGDVYAAVPGAIVRLDASGRIVRREPLLGNAGALAAAPSGRLYMSDLATNRVWVLGRDGRSAGRVVGAGGDERLFSQPRGLAATGDGRLYVVNNTRVTVYQLAEDDHAG